MRLGAAGSMARHRMPTRIQFSNLRREIGTALGTSHHLSTLSPRQEFFHKKQLSEMLKSSIAAEIHLTIRGSDRGIR